MSINGEIFNKLVDAINSLAVFPAVIDEFTEVLKQIYVKKSKSPDPVWIQILRQRYRNSCLDYAEFIKQHVATEFLAKCLQVSDSERPKLIDVLRGYIHVALKKDGRLDSFLGEMSKDELETKIDEKLTEMDARQKKKDKTTKRLVEFSNTVKEQVIDQVGDVFAKFIGPLWEQAFVEGSMAVKSDYEHEELKKAVSNIHAKAKEMEESLDKNRRALRGVDDVLVLFEVKLKEGDTTFVAKEMSLLYPLGNRITDACDEITHLLENLKKVE